MSCFQIDEYKLLSKPRASQSVGEGVGFCILNKHDVVVVDMPIDCTTFEHSEFIISSHGYSLAVYAVIYRPPNS